MAGELDNHTIAKAYAGWAPFYDLVFGAVFAPGRAASIAAAERIGERILDVGVGTGISLADYSPRNRIVGVDFSEPMLRKAQERVARHKLSHIETLAVMDAQHLGFPDGSFDVVVAQFVITAVPDPRRRSMNLPASPSPAEIILVNHLGAEAGLQRSFEHWFAPLRWLGWRLNSNGLAQWAEYHGGVRFIERRELPPLGQFSLSRFGRGAAVGPSQNRAAAVAGSTRD